MNQSSKHVIGIVGQFGAGKDTVAGLLAQCFSVPVATISFSRILIEKILAPQGITPTREHLQEAGQNIDRNAFAKLAQEYIDELPEEGVIITGVRTQEDVDLVRSYSQSFLIAVKAEDKKCFERIQKRNEKPGESQMTYAEFLEKRRAPIEQYIEQLSQQVDSTIENDGSYEELQRQVRGVYKQYACLYAQQPRYFIKTFGCQQNVADSERLASYYEARGMVPGESMEKCDVLVVNTCVIRDKAEERVYGQLDSLEEKLGEKMPHVVVTGCLVGSAAREPSGKMMKRLKGRLPYAEILPLEDIGFEYVPKRKNNKEAKIVISNGCNNYCAYCIVPFARGKEISRPYEDILKEVKEAVQAGHTEILLLGQNVNSYGADFLFETIKDKQQYVLPSGKVVSPVMVKHLSRHRIPTLFPMLLQDVAQVSGVEKVTFLSSNPWDFSEELIAVMAEHTNINRVLHLPVQAGSDAVLARMNRWYTRAEYKELVEKLRAAMPEIVITTDIIVGFPGETLQDFEDTKNLVQEIGFAQTFIAWYSPRPGTAAARGMIDDISIEEKKRRYKELDALAYRGESYY